MSLTFAFVMDPIRSVNVRTDTTFAFMLEAQARGHRVIYVVPDTGLSLHGGELRLTGERLEVTPRQGAHYRVVETLTLEAAACDAIFLRTDPPFDASYLRVTWLLSFAERHHIRVINSPTGVRSANEKLYTQRFPHLCPETLVTASPLGALEFVDAVGGDAIGKPLDGHGGFGVVRLRRGDSNLPALVDLLTLEGRRPALFQVYLQGGQQGDRRLLLLDGVLRGVVQRVPPSGDHRGNVHVGGTACLAEATAQDRAVVAVVAESLRQDGLFFVGLDVIEGHLIEVNVTSPTLVQELRDLGGPDLAAELMEALERPGR